MTGHDIVKRDCNIYIYIAILIGHHFHIYILIIHIHLTILANWPTKGSAQPLDVQICSALSLKPWLKHGYLEKQQARVMEHPNMASSDTEQDVFVVLLEESITHTIHMVYLPTLI